MEIEIDLYKVGYFIGKYSTRILKIIFFAKIAGSGVSKISSSSYNKLEKIAKAHKIDSSNPAIVTENLFNCLQYLD